MSYSNGGFILTKLLIKDSFAEKLPNVSMETICLNSLIGHLDTFNEVSYPNIAYSYIDVIVELYLAACNVQTILAVAVVPPLHCSGAQLEAAPGPGHTHHHTGDRGPVAPQGT